MDHKTKKLRAVAEAFAAQISGAEWFKFGSSDEYQQLVKHVESLHAAYLTEHNARTLLVRTYIDSLRKLKKSQDGSLEQINDLELRETVVESIVKQVELLPMRYVVRVELPSFPAIGKFTISVSDRIRLVVPSDQGTVPQNRLAALIGLHIESAGKPYLEIEGKGYGNESSDSQVTSEGLSLAKQFAFLVSAYGVFERTYKEQRAKAELVSLDVEQSVSIQLSDSIARCFGDLIPVQEKWSVLDMSPEGNNSPNTLLLTPRRPAITEAEKISALTETLSNVKKFYARTSHPDYPSIAAAMEWYQDSIFADNQTFSYLAACIGLEALLGSDDQMDMMSKRLADRYAYMIGNSRAERAELVLEYGKVLRLRGQLVHARQARLSSRDLETLRKAQSMLLDVIWRELQRLLKD